MGGASTPAARGITATPILVAMAFMMGVMSILIGLLAEIAVRVYFESQAKSIYFIRETLNLPALHKTPQHADHGP